MPSFDIVSKVEMHEVENALAQAKKEITTRFDLKDAAPDITLDKETIKLKAKDEFKVKILREIMMGKLAKRNVSLKNLEQKPIENSLSHSTAEIVIKQGIDHDKSKAITLAIRETKIKVTAKYQDQQIRVEGKNRDDLQAVIALCRDKDFGCALGFVNFRN
ncbi:YajQ family cyclic di-GMP-binding protein [Oscillatoria amoena NRMC-F 0135]|nr:YajQ family cyclic di-GMP-binding protein [Oscillatoria laete-virens]MDL5051145.1 YajQ family cyclic di-GMP-binding protein [Oscillatoria amoena NRMC-F 0135]MDL5055051.1 YajQ family cyclic di-GMP-binding protein [Oscillatoria laete-virens NRMC-F 0139]